MGYLCMLCCIFYVFVLGLASWNNFIEKFSIFFFHSETVFFFQRLSPFPCFAFCALLLLVKKFEDVIKLKSSFNIDGIYNMN